jgi:autotransporter translocation and assembly factor TamB
MDETNILSVIALGIPAGGGEVGEAVEAQILTAVMGMATLQFARDFKQRLRLDVLRIEAKSADPAESRVTAGKRLADNLILSYYLDLGADEDEDTNAATLEYRLTRFLSILARGGDSGDVGLQLNLRFQD